MLLEFRNLKLPDFVQGSGQPLTAAWLYFMLKYGCQAPIAANAAVGGWRLDTRIFNNLFNVESMLFVNKFSLFKIKSIVWLAVVWQIVDFIFFPNYK